MSLIHKHAREDAETAFNEFWAKYPRKVAKLEALKAWRQMTAEYCHKDIIQGLERNLPSLARKDKQFVKHPASWLRSGSWMDEPEPVRQPSTGNGMMDAVLGMGTMQ